MQGFTNIAAADLISLSRQKILDNLNTIMSNSSGSTYPTANLQQGMLFYNTTNKCFYVLEDVATPTWTKVLDLLNPFGTAAGATTATKLQTARNINGVAFDGSKDITITAAASGGNAATVGGASAGNAAGNVLVIGADGKVPAANMPIATAAVLGAVKQGANITIAADGTISGNAVNVLGGGVTVTGSTQAALNPTVSGSVNISQLTLSQAAGVSAGAYTLQTLLQNLVNKSHVHSLVTRSTGNCDCTSNCGGDDDGSNY